MLLQILGVLVGIIGLIIKQPIVFIIGGFLCLGLDIFAFVRGTLNPLFSVVLWIIGIIIFRSWTGILFGSIIGQLIEIVFTPLLLFWMRIAAKIKKKGDRYGSI